MENKIQKYFMFFLMSTGSSAFGMEGEINHLDFNPIDKSQMVKAMEKNKKVTFTQCNKYPKNIIKDFNNTINKNLNTKKEGTVFFVHQETFKNSLVESSGYTDNHEQELLVEPLFDSEIKNLAHEFNSIDEMREKNKLLTYLVNINAQQLSENNTLLDEDLVLLDIKNKILLCALHPTWEYNFVREDQQIKDALVPNTTFPEYHFNINGNKIIYNKNTKTLYDKDKQKLDEKWINSEQIKIDTQKDEKTQEKVQLRKNIQSSIAHFFPNSLLFLASPPEVKELVNEKMLTHMRENDYKDWDKLPFIAAINHFNEEKVVENAKITFDPMQRLSNDQINAVIALQNQKLAEENNILNLSINNLKESLSKKEEAAKKDLEQAQAVGNILKEELKNNKELLETKNNMLNTTNTELNNTKESYQNQLNGDRLTIQTCNLQIKNLKNSFSHQWYSPFVYIGTGVLFTAIWSKLPSFGKGPSSPQ